MCGIAGIYNLKGEGLPAFSPRRVLQSIRHRGPDDEGVFFDNRTFLGVCRLAIIDPENGRQPVSDESGRLHLGVVIYVNEDDVRFREGLDTALAEGDVLTVVAGQPL